MRDALPRRALAASILAVCAASLAGFAGTWHWSLDLLSHFRPQFALLLAVTLLVGLWRCVGVVVACLNAACLAAQVGTLLPFWLPLPAAAASAGPTMRVLLANVHTRNRSFDAVRALLQREDPDVVVLQETDAAWLAGLADVRARFAHHLEEARADNFGIAVWSKVAFAGARFERFGSATVPSVVADVQVGEETCTLVATHPLPPAGRRRSRLRNESLAALARFATEQARPVLIVGDLNCSPWSPHFRELLVKGRLRDSADGRGLWATWPSRLGRFGIPIDHCLLGAGLAVRDRRIGPHVGSDHLPLIVDVALTAR